MKKWRKWMANTAFDAAMPLGFAILFKAAPILLIVFIGALICLAVHETSKIAKEKEKANETETEQTDKKAE